MDNQVNTSSRATFVLVAVLILLGVLAVLWYSGHLSGLGSNNSDTTSSAADKSKQSVIESVAKVESPSNPTSQAQVVTSVKSVKADNSAAGVASREAVLKSVQQVK
jgi:hypothetical protein